MVQITTLSELTIDGKLALGPGAVADGLGSAGTPLTICVGCHGAAGSDTAHPGHDMVYTQVK